MHGISNDATFFVRVFSAFRKRDRACDVTAGEFHSTINKLSTTVKSTQSERSSSFLVPSAWTLIIAPVVLGCALQWRTDPEIHPHVLHTLVCFCTCESCMHHLTFLNRSGDGKAAVRALHSTHRWPSQVQSQGAVGTFEEGTRRDA